jgi:hypothetical protein
MTPLQRQRAVIHVSKNASTGQLSWWVYRWPQVREVNSSSVRARCADLGEWLRELDPFAEDALHRLVHCLGLRGGDCS